jgi:hypothetical protein
MLFRAGTSPGFAALFAKPFPSSYTRTPQSALNAALARHAIERQFQRVVQERLSEPLRRGSNRTLSVRL